MDYKDKFFRYYFKSGWDNNMMIAFLSSLPFDSFEEKKDGVIAYLPQNIDNPETQDKINAVCKQYEITFEKDIVQNKNWNEEWETSFEPVEIDGFCLIKADFHKDIDTSDFKYIITITPQMTFGTGHHETTYLMIKMMEEMNIENRKVFDFGTGTGILAILAEKTGASEISAIDNDPLAVENAIKNAAFNQCNNISVEQGESADIKKFYFDIVLANINKNVLLEEAKNLSLTLRKGGFLTLSGILKEDYEDVKNTFENNSLKLMKTLEKGKWIAMKFVAY